MFMQLLQARCTVVQHETVLDGPCVTTDTADDFLTCSQIFAKASAMWSRMTQSSPRCINRIALRP